jgi:predicted ATPase
MSDPRNTLQGLFVPEKRFANFGDALHRIHVLGFRCHQNTVIEIQSPITAFCGLNGTGKSTLLQLAAAAYKNTVGYPRYYVSNFIIAGTLDKRAFDLNARLKYEYLQPTHTDGTIRNRAVTLSRGRSKWTGYKNQPQRRTYFAGVGLYLPRVEEWDLVTRQAKKVVLQSTEPLTPETKVSISKILNSAYDAADENTVRVHGHCKKVVTVGRDGCNYSEMNMGCGEGRIHHIVRVLEALPDRSLVLLEEPETSLHPSAQHEFGKYLVDVCIRKRHQVFLTTHSEYILRALPERSRIFLVRTPSGIKQIPGVSVDQAASLMSDQYRYALHILVEDDVAQAIVSEVMRLHDPYFLKTIRISIGGDKHQIQKFMEVLSEMGLPVCAVRDGDVGAAPKERLFKLPGSQPPEWEVFNSTSFQAMMKTKFDINVADLLVKLAEKNHHEWFCELARLIPFDYNALLQISAGEYLKSVPENDRQTLVNLIKTAVKS